MRSTTATLAGCTVISDGLVKANLAKLAAIPVAFFIGQNATSWIGAMCEAAAALKEQGDTATLEIVPDEGHFIRTLIDGEVLFQLLENFRPR